jgi:predicted amidohydrolase
MTSFKEAVIPLIKKRARQALYHGNDNYEPIHLAAHLFAICCQLLEQGDSLLRLAARRRPNSYGEALTHLTKLQTGMEADELYTILVRALLYIEEEYSDPIRDRLMPVSTKLDSIEVKVPTPIGMKEMLGGTVLHWPRPVPALALQREQSFAMNQDGGPPAPAPHPSEQLSKLAMYWQADPQLPGVHKVTAPDPLLFRLSVDDVQRHGFKIALCPLPATVHPLFAIRNEGQHQFFWAEGFKGEEELKEHLNQLVETAVAEKVQMLVLPELCIDRRARDTLTEALRRQGSNLPYGVVAGSFHLWEEPGMKGKPFNEAVILDQAGREILKHQKRGQFQVSGNMVRAARSFFPGPPEPVNSKVTEGIQFGTTLQIIETSFGRLVVLICADAIWKEPTGFEPLLRRLRPDIVFVVSMSSETEPFEAFIESMNQHRIGTVFVNARSVCKAAGAGEPPPTLAACDLAFFEQKGGPPTRWRWRLGEMPEHFSYHVRDPLQRWLPVSDMTSGDRGVTWLGAEHTLGLVVDLGIHWQT